MSLIFEKENNLKLKSCHFLEDVFILCLFKFNDKFSLLCYKFSSNEQTLFIFL